MTRTESTPEPRTGRSAARLGRPTCRDVVVEGRSVGPSTMWLALAVALMIGESIAEAQTAPPSSATPRSGETAIEPRRPEGNSDRPAAVADRPRSGTGDRTRSDGGDVALPAGLDVIYLPDAKGNLVAVPAGASLTGYLEWLRGRDNGDAPGPTSFQMQSLEFTGTADDERASLTVKLAIEVVRKDAWVRIPLHFTEAAIRSFRHDGPGRAVSEAFDMETGYSCWLFGSGRHELTIGLNVPIRRQVGQRRLQLSIPTSAVSMLQLAVPAGRLSVKAPERSSVSSKASDHKTDVEVVGLGRGIDLVWQVLPETSQVDPLLEVYTGVTATLVDGETLTLDATQRLQALRGAFDEVVTSFPSHYEVLRVDGSDYVDHTVESGARQRVRVRLKKSVAGPVELRWNLRAKIAAGDKTFSIEGFEVEKGRVQTGYIALQVVGDFRLLPRNESDKFVQRVNLVELPLSLRVPQTLMAFRFINQPFVLAPGFERVQPFLTVEPSLLLHATSTGVELEGAFRVAVLRGSLSELPMKWKGWKGQNWEIVSVEPAAAFQPVQAADEQADRLTLRFLQPVKGEQFIRIKARRKWEGPGGGRLTLPMPDAVPAAATVIAITQPDPLDVQVVSSDETPLRAHTKPASERELWSRDLSEARVQWHRHEGGPVALSISQVLREPEIRGSTVIRVVPMEDRFAVHQKMRWEIAFVRLNQVELSVPARLRNHRIRFLSRDGEELRPSSLIFGVDAESVGRLVLPLGRSHAEEVEIEALYELDRKSRERDDPVEVSLLGLENHLWERARVTWDDPQSSASLDDADWQREPTVDGSVVWASTSPGDVVRFRMQRGEHVPLRGLSFLKTWIRSFVSVEGQCQSRARFLVDGSAPRIPLRLARTWQPTAAWWDGHPVSLHPLGDETDGAQRFEVLIPSEAEQARVSADSAGVLPGEPPANRRTHHLTIDCQQISNRPLGVLQAIRCEAPVPPPELRSMQVLWELILPGNQHVFLDPSGFSAEQNWERRGLFWGRVPAWDHAQLATWIDAPRDGNEPVSPTANVYLYSHLGGDVALHISTMSQSALVLVGAGLAMLLGLLLIKVRATRQVFTFLVIGVAMAIVGIWHLGPVLVLLQPALLGALLALLAASIDGIIQRRRLRRSLIPATNLAPTAGMAPALAHSGVGSGITVNPSVGSATPRKSSVHQALTATNVAPFPITGTSSAHAPLGSPHASAGLSSETPLPRDAAVPPPAARPPSENGSRS